MWRKQLIAGLCCLLMVVAAAVGGQASAAATVNPLAGGWQGQLKVGSFILTDYTVLNANGTYSDIQYAFDYWAYAEGTWTAKAGLLTFTAKGCAWNGNVDHCIPGAPGSPYTKTYGGLFRELNQNLLAIYPLALRTWVIYLRVN